MPRLFIAIHFSASIIEKIQNICFGIPGARWVPQNQMHCTLRFLGECTDSVYYEVVDALQEVQTSAFSLALHNVGYFPPRGNPRILWVGMKQCPGLTDLKSSIDARLKHTGVDDEERKFHPHITVARLKDGTPHTAIVPFITQNSLFQTEPYEITEFHLYSSILSQHGATHTLEETFPLQ